jgi:hypothetical protein
MMLDVTLGGIEGHRRGCVIDMDALVMTSSAGSGYLLAGAHLDQFGVSWVKWITVPGTVFCLQCAQTVVAQH